MTLYMILKKRPRDGILITSQASCHDSVTTYYSYYTHSLEDVAKALSEPNVEVYKFGELTRIVEVEVTYQEKPEELT